MFNASGRLLIREPILHVIKSIIPLGKLVQDILKVLHHDPTLEFDIANDMVTITWIGNMIGN